MDMLDAHHDVLDAHSYATRDHPIFSAGRSRYLLAPSPEAMEDESWEGLEAFRTTLWRQTGNRAAGGLLPVHGVPEERFERLLQDRWWRALLLTPVYRGGGALDDEQVWDRLELAGASSLPIMIECGVEGYSRPQQLERFLERLNERLLESRPPRPVVFTHGGQLNISGSHLEAAAAMFNGHPHIYLETSGIYRQDFLEEMLEQLGADRILYGSGHPWMDERLELERVRILPGSDADRSAMIGGNARRLFRVLSMNGCVT